MARFAVVGLSFFRPLESVTRAIRRRDLSNLRRAKVSVFLPAVEVFILRFLARTVLTQWHPVYFGNIYRPFEKDFEALEQLFEAFNITDRVPGYYILAEVYLDSKHASVATSAPPHTHSQIPSIQSDRFRFWPQTSRQTDFVQKPIRQLRFH